MTGAGQLSWLLAAHHSERIRSLSVLSRPHPAAFVRAMREDTAQAERSRHHRAFQADDAVQRMREAGLAPLRASLANQAVPAASIEIYAGQLMEPGGIEGAMSWYRAGAGAGLQAAETPPVSPPTLYVWGRNDATVGARAAELTAEYVTGPYRFETIDEGTHFVVDQFPERVTELVLGHIAQFGG